MKELEEALDTLRQKSSEQGFVTFDEVLDIADRYVLDLRSVDIVTGRLLDERIIILEKKPAQQTSNVNDDDKYDKSQTDYDIVFDEVLTIAPQLTDYVNSVKKIHAPKLGEEHHLIILAQEGNPYALTRLVSMFLKVVIRMALSYHKRYGSPLEDTIQEGNVGLIIAIEKFKKEPDRRFSTYAPWWIRQNIQRNSEGLWLNVYAPVYVKDELLQISRFVCPKNLLAAHGNINDLVSVDEIADGTGIEKKKINNYMNLFREPCSIEYIPDFSTETMWKSSLEKDLSFNNSINEFAKQIEKGGPNKKLSERDKNILKLRFGLTGMEPMTLKEIGDEVRLSRERVRQIIKEIRKTTWFKRLIKQLK